MDERERGEAGEIDLVVARERECLVPLLRLGGDTFVAATQAYYSGTEIVIARAPQP